MLVKIFAGLLLIASQVEGAYISPGRQSSGPLLCTTVDGGAGPNLYCSAANSNNSFTGSGAVYGTLVGGSQNIFGPSLFSGYPITMLGGVGNTGTGTGTVIGGAGNQAGNPVTSEEGGIILAGSNNSVMGSAAGTRNSVILGGSGNTITGAYGKIIGGRNITSVDGTLCSNDGQVSTSMTCGIFNQFKMNYQAGYEFLTGPASFTVVNAQTFNAIASEYQVKGVAVIDSSRNVTGVQGAFTDSGTNYSLVLSSGILFLNPAPIMDLSYIRWLDGSISTSASGGGMGATGASGASGAMGSPGASGADGMAGASGATGASGASGAGGMAGASGATGATGQSGASGASPFVLAGTSYELSSPTNLSSYGLFYSSGNDNVSLGGMAAQMWNNTAGNGPGLYARRARYAAGVSTNALTNDYILQLLGRGYGDTGYSNSSDALIGFQQDEAAHDNAKGNRLTISGTPLGGTTKRVWLNIRDRSADFFENVTSTGTMSAAAIHSSNTITAAGTIYADRFLNLNGVQNFNVADLHAYGSLTVDATSHLVGDVALDGNVIAQGSMTATTFVTTQTFISNSLGDAPYAGLSAEQWSNSGALGGPGVFLSRALYSAGLPIAITSGRQLGSFGAKGYDGTGYSSLSDGIFEFVTLENFTTSAKGTGARIRLTPIGGTTKFNVFDLTPTLLTINGGITSTATVTAVNFLGEGSNLTFTNPVTFLSSVTILGEGGVLETSSITARAANFGSGQEGGGLTINGVKQNTMVFSGDTLNAYDAYYTLHEHSTTKAPKILSGRSNANGSGHTNVVPGQSVLDIMGTGVVNNSDTSYSPFGLIQMVVSATGTVTSTSSPGNIVLATPPDGSTTPVARMTIDSAGNAILAAGGAFYGVGNHLTGLSVISTSTIPQYSFSNTAYNSVVVATTTVVIRDAGNVVDINLVAIASNTTAGSGDSVISSLWIDGGCSVAPACIDIGAARVSSGNDIGQVGFPTVSVFGLSPGSHTIAVRFRVSGGTGTIFPKELALGRIRVEEHP